MMDPVIRQPTRVNNACDRCRRQKQRCDPGRPCRLCLRAKVDCTTDVPLAKRRRTDVDLNVRASSIPAISPSANAPLISQHAHSTSLPNVPAIELPQLSCDTSYPNYTVEVSSPETRPENRAFGSTSQTNHGNAALANLVGTDSPLGLTRKILSSGMENTFQARETFAIPGGDSPLARTPRRVPQRSIPVERLVGLKLPPRFVCDQLLEVYFSTVHWFSLVVYEPTFRGRYSAIIDSGTASDTDYSFVLLLLMVLVMGCWYTPQNTITLPDSGCSSLEELRAQFLKVVREHFIDVIDEDGIESVQLCALLGSFHLYHGRPRSSFSILGAATKTSQAIGLHRMSDPRLNLEEVEERKRVWWTIYTWDRFASISYGRPLGICDKDCNILMPLDSLENVTFRTDAIPKTVCLSTYQTKLNLIYQISSPLLENMYAIRTSHAMQLQPDLIDMVAQAYDAMEKWYSELPNHLRLDLGNTTTFTSGQEDMHKLQALSLQLTYDNLVIVLHRPLLADRIQKSWQSSNSSQSLNHSQLYQTPQSTSFRRCLNAALRISRLHQSQDLVLLARSTHLVSFMGMNLFTASVVLFISAMSDVLSDVAQEAKRGLKRILTIQKQLSSHASLSKQCSAILEDLIRLVLAQEMEDMLCSHSSPRMEFSAEEDRSGSIESRWEIGAHPHSQVLDSSINTRTNSDTDYMPNDEIFLRNSLVSLRKVFAENNNDMQALNADCTARNHAYHNNDPAVHETASNEYINHIHDHGTSTRIEDLSQFWLWDFDIPE